MDERQLAELFRDAADGAPPASFGHADVVTASRRATARRRMVITSSAVIGIAVLAGSMVVGGGFLRDTDRGGSSEAATAGGAGGYASSPSVLDQQGLTPGELAAPPPTAVDLDDPGATAEQGRAASGKVVPWPGLRDDDARAGCGPVAGELVDALVGEFPAASGVRPQQVPDRCPPGARAAAVPVDGGAIYLVLAPVAGDGPADQPVKRDDGAIGYYVYTRTGMVLLVLSVPAVDGGAAPYADQTQRLAETIGQRY